MSHTISLSNDVQLSKNNVDPCCMRRIAEASYNDEASLSVTSGNPQSHRFKSCAVYDSRYFRKVHDSDNYEYLVANKSARYLIFVYATFEEGPGGGLGTGISNASGNGTWERSLFSLWYTNGYATQMTTLLPYINAGHIIKWTGFSNETRRVYNVMIQIFSIE